MWLPSPSTGPIGWTVATERLVEMADAIETANREDSVGVIVITGAGERAFSAGGDLDTVQSDPQQGWSPLGSTEVIRWVNAFRQAGCRSLPRSGVTASAWATS